MLYEIFPLRLYFPNLGIDLHKKLILLNTNHEYLNLIIPLNIKKGFLLDHVNVKLPTPNKWPIIRLNIHEEWGKLVKTRVSLDIFKPIIDWYIESFIIINSHFSDTPSLYFIKKVLGLS
jgi:hypothetical protein